MSMNRSFEVSLKPGGNIDGSLKEYRMVVHLLGAKSSPSCSCYALRKCAEDQNNLMPVDIVFNNFYLDDCLVSVPTDSDAMQFFQKLTEVSAR